MEGKGPSQDNNIVVEVMFNISQTLECVKQYWNVDMY